MSYRDKITKQKESSFFRVSDFQNGNAPEVTLTVAFFVEDVEMFERQLDVLHFSDSPKRLAVNTTNGDILLTLFGDPDNWPNKRVTLYLENYDKKDPSKLGIRLRMPNTPAPDSAPTPVPALARRDDLDDLIPF